MCLGHTSRAFVCCCFSDSAESEGCVVRAGRGGCWGLGTGWGGGVVVVDVGRVEAYSWSGSSTIGPSGLTVTGWFTAGLCQPCRGSTALVIGDL